MCNACPVLRSQHGHLTDIKAYFATHISSYRCLLFSIGNILIRRYLSSWSRWASAGALYGVDRNEYSSSQWKSDNPLHTLPHHIICNCSILLMINWASECDPCLFAMKSLLWILMLWGGWCCHTADTWISFLGWSYKYSLGSTTVDHVQLLSCCVTLLIITSSASQPRDSEQDVFCHSEIRIICVKY